VGALGRGAATSSAVLTFGTMRTACFKPELLFFLAACLAACGDEQGDSGPFAYDASEDATDVPDASSDATDGPDAGSDATDGPDAGSDATDGDTADGGNPWATTATRYPADTNLSPISPFVATTLQDIASRDPSTDAHVFMKAGASGTVSKSLLTCFAGLPDAFHTVELDGRDELQSTIDWFRQGDAAGTTPFDRATICAEVGRSASWAIFGTPSPLVQELAALHPRFAVVNYGTNDMQMGATYRSALYPFFENFTTLIDQLLSAGIVPLISGLGPRADSDSAARWVPTYNAVTRGIAEARQVPYLNMFAAYVDLPGMGLSSDGLHGNVYASGGQTMPCVFDADGLEYAYNTRNLATLTALHWMRSIVNDDAPAPDEAVAPIAGTGMTDDPYVIDTLPFTHASTTSTSSQSSFDAYPTCDSGQDESGPEHVYRFQLNSETAVRIALLDGDGVDVDIHLLGDQPSPDSCTSRADRMIERTLPAGEYHLVVDTFVSGGEPAAGSYLLVVLECEPGDPDCS
jgi:GDSL-like Lipase/Acylhydrolase family